MLLIALLLIPMLYRVTRRLREGRPLLPAWRMRVCQGRAWRRAFPCASKAELREFLQQLVDAFGLASHTRLQFGPNDRLMDIYHHFYPPRSRGWQPDNLELEILERSLAARYPGASERIARVAHDGLTLGELLAVARGGEAYLTSPKSEA